MEFLKKMKSRELVEMSLKTVMGVIVSLILIILMEGMIYNIYIDKINENHPTSGYIAEQCIAYCEEVGEDEFKIYLHNPASGSWSTKSYNESKEEINNVKYGEVIWRAPNAFDININTTHYIVMAVFISGVLAFYGWRFYRLDKEYKQMEKKYKKNGKIFG